MDINLIVWHIIDIYREIKTGVWLMSALVRRRLPLTSDKSSIRWQRAYLIYIRLKGLKCYEDVIACEKTHIGS